MQRIRGEIKEIWLDGNQTAGWIDCPSDRMPAAGQFLLASPLDDELSEPLAREVFPGDAAFANHTTGLIAAPPLPSTWQPGVVLDLRGPFGNGFRLPGTLRRLALAAAGDTAARLLPLARLVLAQGGEASLFSDLSLPSGLPAEVEAAPLAALAENLSWPDFLAVDVERGRLDQLRSRLGLPAGQRLPFAAQALLVGSMPCIAVAAECGLCSVRTRLGWRLACKDGPVFDLNELEW
jgi:hypothetical protein